MRIVSLLILISLLWSCSSLKVQKAKNVDAIKKNSLVYQLTDNQINIQIELTKTTFVPGPYLAYAKTYLEVAPLRTVESESWRISNIKINSSLVADTAQTYLLTGNLNKILPKNLSLLSESNLVETENSMVEDYEKSEDLLPYFNELSLKKLIIEDKKTSYKEVTVDSISKRIPIVNIVVRNKNMEEIAKDAAKTLQRIRKRKFRLIAGLNDSFPEKGDIQFMIAELDKKEQYYLELFMGRTIQKTKKITVSVLPKNYERYSLFKLDKQKGIIDDSLLSQGENVDLIISSTSVSPIIDLSSKIKKKERFLPYRAPKMVDLAIESNGRKIFQTKVGLSQFGQISYLPIDVLESSKLKKDFNTNSIVGIE